jgi:hypothetical protein
MPDAGDATLGAGTPSCRLPCAVAASPA